MSATTRSPLAQVSPLTFRCTGCGNCCRTLRVAVTALDVARLAEATGHTAHELVAWLEPDAVDMTGEPQSFVELSQGRRLMVLRQQDGACQLLGADNRCRAYAARPRDCQAFPFDFDRITAPIERGRRQLTLLPLTGCDYAVDGQNDPQVLDATDSARWRELGHYQALVARWNRRSYHRRRLGKPIGDAAAFLDFAFRQPHA